MRAGLFSGVGGSGFSRGQISQEWVVVGLMRAGLFSGTGLYKGRSVLRSGW